MSTTTIQTATPSRSAALRYYRLAVFVLAVALTAMIAATIYLTVRPTTEAKTTTPPGQVGTSQCFRPAVPC